MDNGKENGNYYIIWGYKGIVTIIRKSLVRFACIAGHSVGFQKTS